MDKFLRHRHTVSLKEQNALLWQPGWLFFLTLISGTMAEATSGSSSSSSWFVVRVVNTSVTDRKQSTNSERDFNFHYKEIKITWVLTVVFICGPHAKRGDSNLAFGAGTG